MEQTPVRRDRPPALVLIAGAAGLLAAAASLWWAFLLAAFGGLVAGGWFSAWTVTQLAAGVLGVWGAMRLVRGRGRLLLAAATALGLRPILGMVADWYAFGFNSPFDAVLGLLPPVALVLVLLPPVRRWSTRPAAGELTTSGA